MSLLLRIASLTTSQVWAVGKRVLPPLCAAAAIEQMPQRLMAASPGRRPDVRHQVVAAAQRREAVTECASPARRLSGRSALSDGQRLIRVFMPTNQSA